MSASLRITAIAAAIAGTLCLGGNAQAQDASSAQATHDPEMVIARTVQPRMAYRGVPLEDNPVQVRATMFPAQVFHGSLGRALGDAMDSELGATASATGRVLDITGNLLGASGQGVALGAPGVATGAPLGMGAAVGGIGGATSSIGSTVSGAINTAMQAMPTTTGGRP